MYKNISPLKQLLFALLFNLLLCLQINAQIKETLIKKLANGVEVYQRKEETTAFYDYPNFSDIKADGGKMEKTEFAVQKLEVILRNQASNQDEIIWSQILKFPKNERAFNYFYVWDVSGKKGNYHVIYFTGLELRVATAVKSSGSWNSKNDTFLTNTSESHDPIIESKFIGSKPKIFAKRYYGGTQEMIYEWKQKKGQWILIKEKVIKLKLPWIK